MHPDERPLRQNSIPARLSILPKTSTVRLRAEPARRVDWTLPGHGSLPDARPSHRYMPGLDGLRALAVLAVIAYHLNFSWAAGGLLGVTVFFVLSGYLITDLLLAEWSRTGRVSLGQFWLRRARRLLPALFTMLAVVLAYMSLMDRSEILAIRGQALAATLYMSNWFLIFHHVSYFASFGPPSPLGHLWSLAIEEQFYLLWPLLLLLGLRFVRRPVTLMSMSLVLALASAVAMALIYVPGLDPTRVYDGTDTRAFSLLIGCALAFLWPSSALSAKVSPRFRLLLNALGALGLLGILVLFWRLNQYEAFLYRGGMVLVSLAAALFILSLSHPASVWTRILGAKPLRWLGVRSYGIYLWHYPVIVLIAGIHDETGTVVLWRALLQVLATLVLAALSFRYVETPIRHGALGRLRERLGSGGGLSLRALWHSGLMPRLALGTAVVGLAVSGLTGVPSLHAARATDPAITAPVVTPSLASGPSRFVHVSEPPRLPAANHRSQAPSEATRAISPVAVSAVSSPGPGPLPPAALSGIGPSFSDSPNLGHGVRIARGHPFSHPRSLIQKDHPVRTRRPEHSRPGGNGHRLLPLTASHLAGCHGVTAIGDSILIDASPYLKELVPGIVVDGVVGRQMAQAPEVLQSLRAHHDLGSCLIVELGTNGPFPASLAESMLRDLGPMHRIVLVNTRVPRPWQNFVNQTLTEVAREVPHTTVVDWYAASAGHPGFFWPDGVHLDPEGARFFARLLIRAVERPARSRSGDLPTLPPRRPHPPHRLHRRGALDPLPMTAPGRKSQAQKAVHRAG